MAAAGVQYWRREPVARARFVLGALRASALLLLVLLLFDPNLSAGGPGGGRAVVLLDGSLSMRGDAGGQTRWEEAVRRATAPGAPVIRFGDGAVVLNPDSTAAASPGATRSTVAAAIRTAAEAGFTRLEVITDGEIEDAQEGAAAALGLGVDLIWTRLPGARVANAALVEFDAPRWAGPGDTVEVAVAAMVVGGAAPDSLRVEVRAGDRLLAAARLDVPAPGRMSRARMGVVVPASPGEMLRLDARVVPGGEHADDDRRSAYMRVAEEGGGVVVVSLEPSWETRFLLPALEAATGMPARGFLAAGPAGFVRTGERAGPVDDATVTLAARSADVLVLEGAGPGAPGWVHELIARGPPLLMVPSVAGAPARLAVSGPALAGAEWYLPEAPPPSPVAASVDALLVDSLPPLENLRPIAPGAPQHTAVLSASRGRRGPQAPVLVIGEGPRGRWAAALADGFWRWSLRGGRARASYRQAWSAVAGWLLAGEPTRTDEPIRPLERVVPRGAPLRWLASEAGDSLRVVFTPAGGSEADEIERVADVEAGVAVMAPLPPGHYGYEASAGDAGAVRANGDLTVESFTREFVRPGARLDDVAGRGSDALSAGAAPLHTRGAPYLLLVLLLATEWVLRRREGLR